MFQGGLTRSIMQEQAFQDCISTQARGSRALVLKGNMGAGKTTTTCGLIKALRDRGNVDVAFRLFGSHAPDGLDAGKALLLFLWQIADFKDNQQRQFVLKLYDMYPNDCPSTSDIVDTLVTTINHLKETKGNVTCIFLDGLNEVSDKDKLSTLLRHLRTIQELTGCGIILTSRLEEISIGKVFGDCPILNVVARREDAEEFIRESACSHTVTEMIKRDAECLGRITKGIIASSGGLFLLIKQNTSHVMGARTEDEFKCALNEICSLQSQVEDPCEKTLNTAVFPTVFDMSLKRLLPGRTSDSVVRAQDARDILTFMRDAARPLRVTELLYLLALRKSPGEFGKGALFNPKELPMITEGLMAVSSSDEVHFVHPWLKAYLQESEKYHSDFPDSNITLATLCINYLSWPRFSQGSCPTKQASKQKIADSPLLDYAVNYWRVHYDRAKPSDDDDAAYQCLHQRAQKFLPQDGFVSWVRQAILLLDPVME